VCASPARAGGCACRQTAESIYHPVGSCQMGPDPALGAVTTPRLRVHGMKGLRVVDASVMPRIVSGNTNAATIMLAEKGAEMIMQDHSLA
jgi:choline dehydrogenase